VPDAGHGARLLWVMMITSAENRAWTGDIEVGAGGKTGLPAPSLVRPAKIATIDQAAATKLGALAPGEIRHRVGKALLVALADTLRIADA
jgi:mRNA interferase MazF